MLLRITLERDLLKFITGVREQFLNFSRKQLNQERISVSKTWFEFVEVASISFLQQGASLKFFCDQKEYIGRSVYYWKKILISLETIKKNRNIPEPTDPLFKHFHSVDIQVQIDRSKIRGRGVYMSIHELMVLVSARRWLSTMSHCTEHPFGQFKSAVLILFPPSSLDP